jgi:flagellar protein FliL
MSRYSLAVPCLLWCALYAAVPWPGGMVWAAEKSEAPAAQTVLRIKPVMVPVLDAKGAVEKYNQVEVSLEMVDAQRFNEAQAVAPRLRDVILAEMYKAIGNGWIVHGSVVNAPALRKRLQEACDEVVGKGSVTRILIAPIARQSAWP